MRTCEKCDCKEGGETIVAGFMPINLCVRCHRRWMGEHLANELLERLCVMSHNQQDRRDLTLEEMHDRQMVMLQIVSMTSSWLGRR
jgi:hypothetical protein